MEENSRRSFLKSACFVCGSALTMGLVSTGVTSCTTVPRYKPVSNADGKVIIPFAALGESQSIMVAVAHLDYDIILIKNSDGTASAFYMQCTHQDNPIVASDKGFYCPSHGSAFNLKGEVTKGPASSDLQQFPVTIIDQQYEISIH